jgi:phthiocerol/phenolphthiocerol synthesis type-I polyketide synthase A
MLRVDVLLMCYKGVAVNHDGKTNGFTAPSRDAQERVIETALKRAGVEPSSVGYLEAHGTGTIIGDNIEMRASGTVLGRNRPKDSPLLIGSVKTSIINMLVTKLFLLLFKLLVDHQKRYSSY